MEHLHKGPSLQKSLLFLSPVFLSSNFSPIRGVQLFDLIFIKQLIERGIKVTVAAECTWKTRLKAHLAGTSPEFIFTPRLFKPQWNSLWALGRLVGRSFDTVVIGNSSDGLIPPCELLHFKRPIPRIVTLAHRVPKKGFAKALLYRPHSIVAVSHSVAKAFPLELQSKIEVYYGIPNATEFYPRKDFLRRDHPIRFCVLGALENEWKGASQAIQAFNALPETLRKRSELHLAAYAHPPQFQETNIFTYPWMDSCKVPEFLRTMDVMIIPSNDQETFSQAMVQGMLSGLPCLSSNVAVLKEKLDAGAGWSYDSLPELTSYMQKMIESDELRREKGIAARKTALERYVWNTDYFINRFLFPN
jgi:glycosyltransferase involved in cell wall biosynthesis